MSVNCTYYLAGLCVHSERQITLGNYPQCIARGPAAAPCELQTVYPAPPVETPPRTHMLRAPWRRR